MTAKEDHRLRALAEEVREAIEQSDRERFGARWDDYCAGRLSEEEAGALTAASEDPNARLAASLFKPLDEELKAAMVGRLQQELLAEEAPQPRALPKAMAREETVSQDELGKAEEPDFPKPHEKSEIARLWDWFRESLPSGKPRLGLAVGAMAGILLMLSLPLMRKDLEPLPSFELSVQGIQAQRSADETAGSTFKAGYRSNFVLRPERAVNGPFSTSVWVQNSSGELQRWRAAEAVVDRSAEGTAFTKDLTWPWGEGDWTLHFIVTRDPVRDEDLRNILREQTPGQDGVTNLSDGYWLQERIRVEP